MIRVNFIASGSAGNACTISDGKTKVLIDCGVPINVLRNCTSLSHIDAILLTHEHGDHSQFVVKLANQLQIPLLTGEKTHDKVSEDLLDYLKVNICAGKQYRIKSLTIMPFNVYHDAVEPLGFLIGNTYKETFAFISDTGTLEGLDIKADNYAIECNYDEHLLRKRLHDKDITDLQYYRMIPFDGHMSVQDVTAYMDKYIDPSAIVYLHHTGTIPWDLKFKREHTVVIEKGVCNESYFHGYIPQTPNF